MRCIKFGRNRGTSRFPQDIFLSSILFCWDNLKRCIDAFPLGPLTKAQDLIKCGASLVNFNTIVCIPLILQSKCPSLHDDVALKSYVCMRGWWMLRRPPTFGVLPLIIDATPEACPYNRVDRFHVHNKSCHQNVKRLLTELLLLRWLLQYELPVW